MQTKTETNFDELTGEVFTNAEIPGESSIGVLKNIRLSRRVRNWLNYQDELIIHEVNTLPSLTIPDQTMTVKDIIDRHTRGLPFTNASTPVYNLDDEGKELMPVDWQRLDISERVERLEQAKAYTERLRKQLDDESKKQKEGGYAAGTAKEAVSPPDPKGDTAPDVSVS